MKKRLSMFAELDDGEDIEGVEDEKGRKER